MNALTGILLLNIGTPEALSLKAVKRYLREFLMDNRVVDIPTPLRWALVNGAIVPFRAQYSLEAYNAIWTESGSPLLEYSCKLASALQSVLGANYKVALGMRYGKPRIDAGLKELLDNGCESIVLLPMFPQYASSSTGSGVEYALKKIAKLKNVPQVKVISDYFNDPLYIAAKAKSIEPYKPFEHLLMSFHGLPVKHVIKSEVKGFSGCDRVEPCPAIGKENRYCYRAQCFATARAIAAQLSLDNTQYSVAFQSRLGKLPWIQPYFDDQLQSLVEQGVKQLAVACPSFTIDCLETLEEIGIRGKKAWQELGGEKFTLIPSLNSDHNFVRALAALVT